MSSVPSDSVPVQQQVSGGGEVGGGVAAMLDEARRLDAVSESVKRPAEVPIETLHSSQPGLPPEQPGGSSHAHDALSLTRDQLRALADENNKNGHPLIRVQALAALDMLDPFESQVHDHGTWHGSWPLPSRTEWKVMETLGMKWPCGHNEAYAVQAARKEYKWHEMKSADKPAYAEAAVQGWKVWTENDAVQLLSKEASERVVASLRARGELHRLLQPRWVFTDKNDGLRTRFQDLPVRASARLVVPGYRDLEAYNIRKDAPTASRISQHMIFIFTACKFKKGWRLKSADIKAAFMKGEVFQLGERELYILNTKGTNGEPQLPFEAGCIGKLKKGIFGLSDSPRRWYLRLNKALQKLGWTRSNLDYALWFLWGNDCALKGVIASHVDDLLCGGDEDAMKSLDKLGEELGFGSLESGSFQYCGKRIEQGSDGTTTVSMKEYHSNMKTVTIPVDRRRQPDSELSPSELKQLRGLLGSLQWLVTQVRFDQQYGLSVLQSEKPRVSTLVKANALVRRFKEDSDFSLVFKPFDLTDCGVMVVTDSSLGNVRQDGSVGEDSLEKVFSQSAYIVLLGDSSLMAGKTGSFGVVDSRSHRISRVCRSTYGAELLGAEESFDIGQFVRGVVSEFQGFPVLGRNVDFLTDAVGLTVVTDAKDVYDRCGSDTSSYGSQKSLAFTIAWLRYMLQRPNTLLRWTATQNNFIDAGTKDMAVDHLQKIMRECVWNACYEASFVKQGKTKVSKPKMTVSALPGIEMNEADPMYRHVIQLGDVTGWHQKQDCVIQVARNARSFRTPRPRFASSDYPVRSSFGRFDSPTGGTWRRLESGVQYEDLANPQGLIGATASILISCFHHAKVNKEEDLLKNQQLTLGDVT
jgi:hypothetical protein